MKVIWGNSVLGRGPAKVKRQDCMGHCREEASGLELMQQRETGAAVRGL